MHVISKKDLNSAELETVTTSRSPTTAITANDEVQTHEEATVCVKELDLFLTMRVLEDTPAVLSLRKLCDEHGYSYELITGQKPHLINNFVPIVVPGLSTSSSSSLPSSTSMTSSTVSSESVARQEREDPCGIDSYPTAGSSKHVERQERGPCSSEISEEQLLTKPTKNPKPNKNTDHDQERRGPCHSDIPEWLQEFRENLVDNRDPEHRDSHASSSHESSLEHKPARSSDLGKHSVYTHFPKDRNCEICQRPKLQAPRAEDAIVELYFVLKILVTS